MIHLIWLFHLKPCTGHLWLLQHNIKKTNTINSTDKVLCAIDMCKTWHHTIVQTTSTLSENPGKWKKDNKRTFSSMSIVPKILCASMKTLKQITRKHVHIQWSEKVSLIWMSDWEGQTAILYEKGTVNDHWHQISARWKSSQQKQMPYIAAKNGIFKSIDLCKSYLSQEKAGMNIRR